MQFLILAYDGTDEQALERRLAARQTHLEAARQLKAEGHFLEGGAILDESGQMIGSMLLMEFSTRAECDSWLASDPYTTGDVWQRVEIHPFRRAPI